MTPALHHRAVDLTGIKFGRLVALAWTGRRERNALVWKFQCDCGNVVERVGVEVTQGRCSSCGCWAKEEAARRFEKYARPARITAATIHGKSKTRTFYAWGGMKDRCSNPNNKDFAKYGGRGISVCQRWLDSFENFLADMGEKPDGMTLDRIEVNGNYEPSNCRWASPRTQVNNRRKTTMLTMNGVTKPLTEWADEVGLGPKTIMYRLKQGWDVKSALTEPLNTKRKHTL